MNKAGIQTSILAKADERTVQYAYEHVNNFPLLSVAPKKNKRVIFLSTINSEKRWTRQREKKKIIVFYYQEKGGLGSHVQNAVCTPRREK